MNFNNLILANAKIIDALKLLDQTALKLLVVVDESSKLKGTCSDGDIRRLLLKGASLQDTIEDGFTKEPITVSSNEFSEESLISVCKENHIFGIPIINAENIVIDFFSYEKGLITDPVNENSSYALPPVVIMCGGKGTRLKPISDIFPKPLIPINGKPMIEYVMEYFSSHGANKFYLVVNYKSELIKAYFNGNAQNYNIEFIQEPKYMGTAGGLSLIDNISSDDLIISNSDCLLKANLNDALKQHQETKSDLTVVTSIKHHQVPYGVVQYTNGGLISKIDEKPEFSFPMNTGVYIAKKNILDYVQNKEQFHMTDLIKILIDKQKKVACYFINEKEFIDFGQWNEYKKAMKLFEK